MGRPTNVLLILTDQMRHDVIRASGNEKIYTPNLDQLISDGVVMDHAYSPTPVCVPARYCIRTGCTSLTTRYFQNEEPHLRSDDPSDTRDRCGPFLAHYMRAQGYRTFGVGKFHTIPVEEDIGYDVYLRCEEMDGYPDAYTRYIESQPAYRHLEQLQGERTNMYYQPQSSALPKEVTSESWVADRVIEQLHKVDDRPFFGVASFVGPHPPFAPPVPFNRMYDPDTMDDPISGPDEIDFMDERVRWNSYFVFAEDMSTAHIRTLKSRYYGEISYIDWCIGKMIRELKALGLYDDTMVIFTSDHGEFLGDHQAVQKENFFEASTHVPMIITHARSFGGGTHCAVPVSLTDLFGLVTSVTDKQELREGCDIAGILADSSRSIVRKMIFGISSAPGSLDFRMMVLAYPWKYVFHANGGGELLFDLSEDVHEQNNRIEEQRETATAMRTACIAHLLEHGEVDALENGSFKVFERTVLPLYRCYQFNSFRSVTGFPDMAEDISYTPMGDYSINIQSESKIG
jgi:arylsulfatase